MTVKGPFGAAICQKTKVTLISATEIQRFGGSGPLWRGRGNWGEMLYSNSGTKPRVWRIVTERRERIDWLAGLVSEFRPGDEGRVE